MAAIIWCFLWNGMLVCVLIHNLVKRLPEHLLPDDCTDCLWASITGFAITCDQDLLPVDVGHRP